jgi:hypothetical protein
MIMKLLGNEIHLEAENNVMGNHAEIEIDNAMRKCAYVF